jgi:hypothetical protein
MKKGNRKIDKDLEQRERSQIESDLVRFHRPNI